MPGGLAARRVGRLGIDQMAFEKEKSHGDASRNLQAEIAGFCGEVEGPYELKQDLWRAGTGASGHLRFGHDGQAVGEGGRLLDRAFGFLEPAGVGISGRELEIPLGIRSGGQLAFDFTQFPEEVDGR